MSEAVAGVGLLVAAFTDEDAGDQVLDGMKKAKKQGQFYFEEAAVVRQDAEGKVHHKETGDMKTGKGAGIGALIGGVVGILGGPAGIVLGAGAGAAVGAVAAHGDAGFDDKSLQEIGVALKPGSSAVMAITSKQFLKAVRKDADQTDLKTAVKNLADDISAQLDAGKNVAYSLAITEEGVAVSQITADDESAQYLGIVATDEGVVAGAAVVTDEGAAYQVGVATDEGVVTETAVTTDDAAAVVDTVTTTEEGTVAVGQAAVAADDDTTTEADAPAEGEADEKKEDS